MPDSIKNGTGVPDDDALAAQLRAAYGQMGADDGAVSRMRAAVMGAASGEGAGDAGSAAAKPDAAGSAGGATGGPNSAGPTAAGAARSPRRKRAWLWALPAAACLIVGIVAFGVMGGTDAAPDGGLSASAPGSLPAAEGDSAESALYAQEESGLPAPEPYLDANTEEYAAVDETGFISTKANPLSTVSADVDTASYCNLRRMLNGGYGPDEIPAGSVRIEEMLNYFRYGYDAPSGSDLFGMTMRAGTCPWNDQTKLLVMGFSTAPEAVDASKGSNLVFLIDVSGSMDSPDKLELLQDSFATLLDGLDGDDRVSIVTYSGEEQVVLEGARGDDSEAILRAIYRLRADGMTNGEAGLKMAYDVAERNRIEGGVNRIIMASDGDLNVGMTSESDLHDFVDSKRESGIYLSVLGFGSGNYKDTKMETLADHGNGQYHYIDCIEEAERVFGENLTANLVPLADDVKVQVEFNPAQVKAYRLIGYENREMADEDFKNDDADAGEVGPGSQFTVAYEVALADSAFEVAEPDLKYGAAATGDASNPEWLTCSLRYKPAGGGEAAGQSASVGPDVLADDPGDDWRFAAAVIEFGMVLRDSGYAGDSSLDAALKLVEDSHPDDGHRGLADLIRLAKGQGAE